MTLDDALTKLERLSHGMPPGPYEAMDYTHKKAGGLGVSAPSWGTFIINPGAVIDPVSLYFAELTPERILALVRVAKAAKALDEWVDPVGIGPYGYPSFIPPMKMAYDINNALAELERVIK